MCLRENSKVFTSEFSVLAIMQNGKLAAGKPPIGFDQCASEKPPRFSVPVLGIVQNGKL